MHGECVRNGQRLRSVDQRLRSHEARVRLGGLAETSYSTLLGWLTLPVWLVMISWRCSDLFVARYLHLATSEMWCWSAGRGILVKLLCVTVACTITQWYKQFLQVSQLHRALILLGLALCLQRASASLIFMVLCRYLKKILFTSFSIPFSCFSKLSLVGLALDVVD